MALEVAIIEMLRRRIEPEYEESRQVFAGEATKIAADCSLRGLGRSGALIEATDEAAGKVVYVRITTLWNALRDILAAAGVRYSEELAQDLKIAVSDNLRTSDLEELVRRRVDNMGLGPGTYADAIGRARRIGLQRCYSDIDLYVLALKQEVESGSATTKGNLVLNFHGPVGAVQTGAGSTATVTQHLGDSEKDALLKALDLVERLLSAIEAAGGPPRVQLEEIVTDCRAEIAKPTPNRLKITSLAGGLATAIQTVAVAGPAYTALRSALSLVGIHLPDIGTVQ